MEHPFQSGQQNKVEAFGCRKYQVAVCHPRRVVLLTAIAGIVLLSTLPP
jgi:hypothetical protein